MTFIRSILILGILAIIAGCDTELQPVPSNEDADIIPLTIGNEWRYERERFVRGGFVERDTVILRVIDKAVIFGKLSYKLELDDPYQYREYYVYKASSNDVVEIDSLTGDLTPLVDISYTSPISAFLGNIGSGSYNSLTYQSEQDTVFEGNIANRISQTAVLLDSLGTVQLRMRFEHILTKGIGLTAIRFISDINECLACKLHSEFMTYKLINWNLR